MTQPRKNNPDVEDQLVEFTDRILAKEAIKQDEATFAPDPDLRALEQTALRLKNAFGDEDPSEVAIQHMRDNIVRQWQQGENKTKELFWKKWVQALRPSEQKWQSQRSRQRFSMALSLATLVVLMLVGIPFLNSTGSNQPGASGQTLNAIVLIAFGGLILLALWFFRRKP